MARTNRFRAEDQLSALLVENRLTNDRNLCHLFDEQVKRTPKSALEQCSLLFEFSSSFIQLNSYWVWHSRLGSTERPTGICVSHGAIATRMVNIDPLTQFSSFSLLSVGGIIFSRWKRSGVWWTVRFADNKDEAQHYLRANYTCSHSPKESLLFLHLPWTKGEIVQRRSRALFV